MTLSTERLAELRKEADMGFVSSLSLREISELAKAADDLNALLAAAEHAVLMMSTKNSGELRAAIRRAKGEKP